MDDAGLGGGAAHVEGDGVLEPDAIAQCLGADHARRGSGFQHPDARALRLLNVEQAAGRLHDQEFARKAGGIEMVAHLAEIAPHARSDIGIRRRRRGALELTILLRQLVRGRDEEIGMALGDDRLCPLLVRGIAVGMQEQDGDRLYAATDRVGRRRPHRILIERDQHFPLRVHALADLVTQITLDQRLVAAKEQVVGFRPVDAADLVDIAKALRGEKRAGCPGALQDGVDRDGGAVQKKPRGAKLRSRLGRRHSRCR